MNKIKRITVIFSVVFLFLIAEIPVANSNAVLSYSYPTKISSISPNIVYDNSTNFPPFWWTNLNSYKDQAYMNVTSIWSSGITCDDNGNVFWTDTYGNVYVAWVRLSYSTSYLGSPYSQFKYAGPITSIASINITSGNNYYQYVVLLTYYGYVFGYNLHTKNWFNATSQWGLTLQNYPGPWTSVHSNLEGYYNGYDEGFIFTNFYGNLYQYDPLNPSNSFWVYTKYSSTNSLNIISVCSSPAGYDKYRNTYGISYDGKVYVEKRNDWNTYNSTSINGLKSITIDSLGYLYLLQINNSTKLYRSSSTAGSQSGTFSSYGNVVFSKGTNEAITYDQSNNIFWAIQTNGTIAKSTNNANSWTYLNNRLSKHSYPTILALNSTYSLNFNAYAQYVKAINYTDMFNFTLYFIGSDHRLNLEYTYQLGSWLNPHNPALLTSTKGILINITMMPNMAYNSYFNFYVIIYPQNNPNSVIFVYILNIRIINHFSYIPLGG